MRQVSSGSAPRAPSSRHRLASARLDSIPPAVLVVLPRLIAANPLRTFLTHYDVRTGNAWAHVSSIARERPCDLYVLYTPLRWIDGAALCGRLRSIDPGTPIVLYSTEPSMRERREMLAAGAHGYVGRGEGAQNLAGAVAQLIMLSELRSMEALAAHRRTFEERIGQHLAADRARGNGSGLAELKLEARNLFTRSGGSPANFERMWPALYARALSTRDART